MKKFSLVTEYSQEEILNLITQSIQTIVTHELQKVTTQLSINSQPQSDQLLSRNDLKKMLGLSYPTLIKLHKDGTLRGKAIGGIYRYKQSDVSIFLSTKKNHLNK